MSIPATPKRRGRPATGRDPTVGFRLPQELIDRLNNQAVAEGINRTQIVRRVLEQALTEINDQDGDPDKRHGKPDRRKSLRLGGRRDGEE